MSLTSLLTDGAWSGLLSGAFVIIFSAPLQVLAAAVGAGFMTRSLRDALMQAGASQALATFAAAAAVVVVMRALIQIRRPGFSPVVLLSGLIPLGAAKPFFEAIVGLVRVPLLAGDALAAAPIALMSNLAAVFTMTLALALGVAVGALIVEMGKSMSSSDDMRMGP